MLQYDTVIVANGEPPAHPEALRLLHEARTIVCCDGAVGSVVALGVELTTTVSNRMPPLWEPKRSSPARMAKPTSPTVPPFHRPSFAA